LSNVYDALAKSRPVLRTGAWVFGLLKCAAAVCFVVWGIGLRGVMILYVGSATMPGWVVGLLTEVLWAVVWWVAIMAAAELITVFVDIDRNTRATAEFDQQNRQTGDRARAREPHGQPLTGP